MMSKDYIYKGYKIVKMTTGWIISKESAGLFDTRKSAKKYIDEYLGENNGHR